MFEYVIFTKSTNIGAREYQTNHGKYFYLLRLWELHHVNTKVQASFIHSCLRIIEDKIRVMGKISQVNKDGKNCKINYDHHVLINLPGDGVFFKVHLTIKTNYNYTQVCVWNIS